MMQRNNTQLIPPPIARVQALSMTRDWARVSTAADMRKAAMMLSPSSPPDILLLPDSRTGVSAKDAVVEARKATLAAVAMLAEAVIDGRVFDVGPEPQSLGDIEVFEQIDELVRDRLVVAPFDEFVIQFRVLCRRGSDPVVGNYAVVVKADNGRPDSFSLIEGVFARDGRYSWGLMCNIKLNWPADDAEDKQLYYGAAYIAGGEESESLFTISEIAIDTISRTLVKLADARVVVTKHSPPEKLRAARERKGAYVPASYWTMDDRAVAGVELYRTRAVTTQGDDHLSGRGDGRGHASPTPHTRRAHMRQLRSGKSVYVRSAQIGAVLRHLTRRREFYEVSV